MTKIVERIERDAGVPGLVSILAERLAPTDLQSLLLEVYRIRSSRIQPASVLSDFESNRFVRPSPVSPLFLLKWEQIAFSHLPPEFQPVALSPVCPLGTNSAVAAVDQNWAVSTIRNTEVVSDSTNVLALECALRRRDFLRKKPKSTEQVHLAATHRLVRAQNYAGHNLAAHFSLFALCSAGRKQGQLQFELSALQFHIHFYLRSLRALLGPDVPLSVAVTVLGSNSYEDLVESRTFAAIRFEFQHVECGFDQERTGGRGYYTDLCFHIYADDSSGRRLELVDGGAVNWTQRLLSNAQERLVVSGIGSERLAHWNDHAT